MKPVIVMISSELCLNGEKPAIGEAYINAVLKAGGEPLVISREDDLSVLDTADGLLVPGGKDVCPRFYNQQPCSELGPTDEGLDLYEMAAIMKARCMGMPILGICRGCQIINVTFGGSLIQDIGGHRQPSDTRENPVHKVRINGSSILAQYTESSLLDVNSLHHQVVDKVAPGFKPNAVSYDGYTEGIENGDNILAVQWHPESLSRFPEHLSIFRWLVDKAGSFRDSFR